MDVRQPQSTRLTTTRRRRLIMRGAIASSPILASARSLLRCPTWLAQMILLGVRRCLQHSIEVDGVKPLAPRLTRKRSDSAT